MSSSKDYDARMIDVWANAALHKDGIILPFLTADLTPEEAYSKAVVQRHRFYRLRSTLVKEKHKAAGNAGKCKVRLRVTTKQGKEIYPSTKKTWDDKDVTAVDLIFISHAADETMDKALASAGFKVPEAPDLG